MEKQLKDILDKTLTLEFKNATPAQQDGLRFRRLIGLMFDQEDLGGLDENRDVVEYKLEHNNTVFQKIKYLISTSLNEIYIGLSPLDNKEKVAEVKLKIRGLKTMIEDSGTRVNNHRKNELMEIFVQYDNWVKTKGEEENYLKNKF